MVKTGQKRFLKVKNGQNGLKKNKKNAIRNGQKQYKKTVNNGQKHWEKRSKTVSTVTNGQK